MTTGADFERLERRVKMHERVTVAVILSAVCAVGWSQTRTAPTKTPIEIHLEGTAPLEEQKREHISERELNQTLAEFEMRERGRLMLSSFAPSVVHTLQDIANAEAFHALYLSDRIEALESKLESKMDEVGRKVERLDDATLEYKIEALERKIDALDAESLGVKIGDLGKKIDDIERKIDEISDHVTP